MARLAAFCARWHVLVRQVGALQKLDGGLDREHGQPSLAEARPRDPTLPRAFLASICPTRRRGTAARENGEDFLDRAAQAPVRPPAPR